MVGSGPTAQPLSGPRTCFIQTDIKQRHQSFQTKALGAWIVEEISHDDRACFTSKEFNLQTTSDSRFLGNVELLVVEATWRHQHTATKRAFTTSRLTKHDKGREIEVPDLFQDLQQPGVKEDRSQWQWPCVAKAPSAESCRRACCRRPWGQPKMGDEDFHNSFVCHLSCCRSQELLGVCLEM